jgi:hypothetical protein
MGDKNWQMQNWPIKFVQFQICQGERGDAEVRRKEEESAEGEVGDRGEVEEDVEGERLAVDVEVSEGEREVVECLVE